MPPIVALSAGFLFSGYLLAKGARRFPDASVASWIPTLWMMRCASRSLTWWVYPGSEKTAQLFMRVSDTSVHDQVFFSSLMLLAFFVLCGRLQRLSDVVKSNQVLILLFAYMAFSAFWSPEPIISLKRWFRTLGDLLVILVVLSEPNRRQAVAAMFWRCMAVLIPLSITLSKYYPSYARSREKGWRADMWIGVTTHKNSLGALALLAVLLYLWLILERGGFRISWKEHRLDLVLLVISFWLLFQSESATSLLACVFGGALLSWVRSTSILRRQWIWGIFVVLMGVPLAITFTGTVTSSRLLDWTTDVVSRDSTLTGRTDLWREVIRLGSEHPMLGRGFEAFWDTPEALNLSKVPGLTWGPHQGHNGYIDIYVNLGFVGLVLLVMVCGQGVSNDLQMARADRFLGDFMLVILLITLLHNMTESSFGRPTQLMWFTFLLAVTRWSSVGRAVRDGWCIPRNDLDVLVFHRPGEAQSADRGHDSG